MVWKKGLYFNEVSLRDLSLWTEKEEEEKKKYHDSQYPVWSDTATSYSAGNVIWFNILKPAGYMMHQQVQEFLRIVLCTHTVFMCFIFISEQTATCATYTIN